MKIEFDLDTITAINLLDFIIFLSAQYPPDQLQIVIKCIEALKQTRLEIREVLSSAEENPNTNSNENKNADITKH